MRGKARVLWWRFTNLVRRLRFFGLICDMSKKVKDFYIESRGHKRFILWLSAAVAGCLVVLVCLANFMPGLQYKDKITIGSTTITSADIEQDATELQTYINVTPNVSTVDNKTAYEAVADELIVNAALKDELHNYGIQVTDEDLLASNNIILEEGESLDDRLGEEGTMERLHYENNAYKTELSHYIIAKKYYTMASVNFDAPYFRRINDSDVMRYEYGAVEQKLKDEFLPLLQHGAIAEDLGSISDETDNIFDGDMEWSGDNSNLMQLYNSRPVYVASKSALNKDFYTSVRSDSEHAKLLPDIESVQDMNEVLWDMDEIGDVAGPIYTKADLFLVARLDDIGPGKYDSWDSYEKSILNRYAYRPISFATQGIKDFASTILGRIGLLTSTIVSALEICDTVGHQFFQDFYIWDANYPDVLRITSGVRLNSVNQNSLKCNTAGSGILNQSQNWQYAATNNINNGGLGINDAWGLGAITNSASGPMASAGNGNGQFIDDCNTYAGIFFMDTTDYDWVRTSADAWDPQTMAYVKFYTNNGEATVGNPLGPYYPIGSTLTYQGTTQKSILQLAWMGGIGLANAADGAHINLYVKQKAFQPAASSKVSTTTIPDGNGSYNIKDTIYSSTINSTTWISGVSVRYDSDLYHCASQQQKGYGSGSSTVGPSIPPGCQKVATTNTTFNGSGQSREIEFVGNASNNNNINDNTFMPEAGYYYIVTKILKSNNISVSSSISSDWYTPFADDNEQIMSKYQPFAISTTLDSSSSAGDYISASENAIDYIKVYASSVPNALDKANDGLLSADEANNSNWPKDSFGNYIPVKYKAHMFGPYQTPQANITNDTTNGLPAPTINSPWPSNVAQYVNSADCIGVCVHKVVAVNSASGNNSTATGIGITPNVNTLNGNRGLAVNFGIVSEPGYYYYTIEVVRSEQIQTSGGTTVSNFIVSNYWKSEFNPNRAGQTENEWTFRKFQPFITSNVLDSKPWIDVKEDNSTGEDIVDRVVARAAKSYEEATNGYQTGVDNDSYWPKYSSAEKNGDYVPIKYNFYICGPFQYPQNEGTSDDLNNNNSVGGTYCNKDTAIKTISRFVTPDSCSTDETVATINRNNYTSDATGIKSCAINFGRTGKNGQYYQPGYYYFTSEMLKSEQTMYASVDSSSNPGLTTTTPISNFVSKDWKSKFNPLWTNANTRDEIEWAYVQFQPVAQSYAGATQSESSPNENNWTTRLSYQYTNVNKQYRGLQLNCNEHNSLPTYTDMANDNNFWNKVPAKTLTCENVSDRVYLGATTTKDVDYGSTKLVKDDNEDEKNWPKTNDSLSGLDGKSYETIKYRTKLYGPFATADIMTSGTLQANPSAGNEAGSTVTIVPGNVSNMAGQPVAESCLTSAKYGPNYNDKPAYNTLNPNLSLNAYYYQNEKTSISDSGYYKSVFTRDTDIDCAPDGSGALGLLDGDGIPYTTLLLKPGVYVSVVEVWKSDMNENNRYDAGDTSNESANFNDNGNRTLDTQTINSADKRGQITNGEVRDLMANDFHSKWGDAYETIFVPPDTNIWTLRGNMQNYKVDWGARYSDQYWTAGWSDWCTNYKDIFGNCLPEHNDANSSYQGEDGYFAPDKDPTERAGQLRVDLYGAFELRPSEATCPADKRIATWYVDTIDTDKTGNSTKLENMIPSAGDGWYVYVFSYSGDDRIPAMQTKCSDPDEQFYLGEPPAPELETEIDIISTGGKAPTVVSDTVTVSGWVDKDSLVKLSLYRRGGMIHNPKADTQVCSVQFKIPHSSDPTKYYVSDYMDKNGYVFASNTPDDVAADPNRCFAEEAGHYYWHEEFYDPEGEVLKDDPDGPNEWADIEEEKPDVTTMADAAVKVGDPFHDIAYVTLPEGNTKVYNLYMRAYGPTNGVPVCDTVNKSNLLFESGPHEVTKSGTYPSSYTTSLTPGYVYWIETLIDKETDEVVAEGSCGKELEITRIYETPAPGEEWEWTSNIGAPLAGDIVLSAAKIIGLIGALSVGAWQLSDKKSWLMRHISKK